MTTALVPDGHSRVWWATPQQPPADTVSGVLSPPELERAMRFHRDADRRRFLTACLLLRAAAAAHLDIAPHQVHVERRCPDCGKPHGKPHILHTPEPLYASVSHSGDRVAVALSTAGPIGVDVEQIPDAPVNELIRSALTPAEQDFVRSLPERHQHAAFTRIWVIKEAVLKATGHGLRVPPRHVSVSYPHQPPALLDWPLDVPVDELRLSALDPGPGYAGMIATISGAGPVSVMEAEVDDLTRMPFTTIGIAA
ncbi:4'-phosphopantetheinyl transferase superfamily protein [Sphaerisporangium rubeum]|uniref:4'-phosphopantetheinyl transferase n=1 Tax=Sphaerisporangium rubeum TaxID=321317 RepID=A0A7X0ICG5_9ACTN|nr:4'-phosphopantetheinyl transferase [Sphaerisporangium rubeum]